MPTAPRPVPVLSSAENSDASSSASTVDTVSSPVDSNSSTVDWQESHAWAYWKHTLASPRWVVSPMVNQSESAFRILCARYGAELAYTPMIHSRLFSTLPSYRAKHMPPRREERGTSTPLIAQLNGNDAKTLVDAARHLVDRVEGVDVNCGCPQGIARRGDYGAFLLNSPDLLVEIATAMVAQLSVPVFFKIRLIDTEASTKKGAVSSPRKGASTSAEKGIIKGVEGELRTKEVTPEEKLKDERDVRSESTKATIDLCRRLAAAGVSGIALHGRTIKNKGQQITKADWGAIAAVVAAVPQIPIIANGSVEDREEAERCLEETGAAAVMCAEALLSDPSAFCVESGRQHVDDLMIELCDIYDQFPQPLEAADNKERKKAKKADGGLKKELQQKVIAPSSAVSASTIFTNVIAYHAENDLKSLKAHIWHALHKSFKTFPDLRAEFVAAKTTDNFRKVLHQIRARQASWTREEKLGYYRRHREPECQSEKVEAQRSASECATQVPSDSKREGADTGEVGGPESGQKGPVVRGAEREEDVTGSTGFGGGLGQDDEDGRRDRSITRSIAFEAPHKKIRSDPL